MNSHGIRFSISSLSLLLLVAWTLGGCSSESGGQNSSGRNDSGDVLDATGSGDSGATETSADVTSDATEPEDATDAEDATDTEEATDAEDPADAGDAGNPNVCEIEVCLTDDECSDGEFCNGQEQCTNPVLGSTDSNGCVPGDPPCDGPCNEQEDRCGCTTDADCQDGDYCNGDERCDPADPDADANGCVHDTPPQCLVGTRCDEFDDACCTPDVDCTCETDADCDDGLWCNGHERCLPNDQDADKQGCVGPSVNNICLFVECDETRDCCVDNRDGSCISIDGDDTDPCGDYADADGDGHEAVRCGGDDCDDGDSSNYPGNTEVCDDHDDDCNPRTLGGTDADNDGYISEECCNEQPDGTVECGTDRDDNDPTINPGEEEICNGEDDDSDGLIDENVSITLYKDNDGDGFGQPACNPQGCPNTAGFVETSGDCNDSNPAIKPGASECLSDSVVRTCQSDGTWKEGDCPQGTECKPQPNGTGLCL